MPEWEPFYFRRFFKQMGTLYLEAFFLLEYIIQLLFDNLSHDKVLHKYKSQRHAVFF